MPAVSGFSADWLALREPADQRARAPALATGLRQWLGVRRGQTLRAVELACGTGAGLRWLAPRLGGRQHWTLHDSDPALLAALPQSLQAWATPARLGFARVGASLRLTGPRFTLRVLSRQLDLARVPLGAQLRGAQLVTASALLDLVSERWLQRLVAACRAHGCAALITLSYDGRCSWSPALSGDGQVQAGHDRHQRMDKGFGPAAGPTAAGLAARAFRAAGYRVQLRRSDWCLGPEQSALQTALAQGWAEAAGATLPAQARLFEAWLSRRLALCRAGRSTLQVGHLDLLALPPA